MAAYRRVYDSRHLQADCQEPGLARKPYARQSSLSSLYFLNVVYYKNDSTKVTQNNILLTPCTVCYAVLKTDGQATWQNYIIGACIKHRQ